VAALKLATSPSKLDVVLLPPKVNVLIPAPVSIFVATVLAPVKIFATPPVFAVNKSIALLVVLEARVFVVTEGAAIALVKVFVAALKLATSPSKLDVVPVPPKVNVLIPAPVSIFVAAVLTPVKIFAIPVFAVNTSIALPVVLDSTVLTTRDPATVVSAVALPRVNPVAVDPPTVMIPATVESRSFARREPAIVVSAVALPRVNPVAVDPPTVMIPEVVSMLDVFNPNAVMSLVPVHILLEVSNVVPAFNDDEIYE
jgi:hypothetical protein